MKQTRVGTPASFTCPWALSAVGQCVVFCEVRRRGSKLLHASFRSARRRRACLSACQPVSLTCFRLRVDDSLAAATRDRRCVGTHSSRCPHPEPCADPVMSAFSPPLTLDTLPSVWQSTLRKLHSIAPARGGGGDAAWTLDEDACILHKRYNPRIKREAWLQMQIGEVHVKGQGAKKRHNIYLVPEGHLRSRLPQRDRFIEFVPNHSSLLIHSVSPGNW